MICRSLNISSYWPYKCLAEYKFYSWYTLVQKLIVVPFFKESLVRSIEDASDAKSAVEALARQLFTNDELKSSSVTGFQCNKDYEARPGLSPSRRSILESKFTYFFSYPHCYTCFYIFYLSLSENNFLFISWFCIWLKLYAKNSFAKSQTVISVSQIFMFQL